MTPMTKPLVVLADPDSRYLESLEVKLFEDLGDRVSVETITNESYLESFLGRPHDIEALVIAEEWLGFGVDRQNASSVIVLTEDDDADRTGSIEVDYLYKYSSLALVYGKLVSTSPKLRSDEAAGTAKLLLFYSPQGGSGKTTCALGVAACLRERYKRVLYIDAENIQTFGGLIKSAASASQEMLRSLQQSTGNAFESLREFVRSDLFDYLPPARSCLTACGLDLDVYRRFAVAARESGEYDYVVVDTDSSLDAEKLAFFGVADNVVVPLIDDKQLPTKVDCLLASIDGADRERYRFFWNRYRERPGGVEPSIPVELDAVVGFEKELQGTDATHFGTVDSLRRLAESLA